MAIDAKGLNDEEKKIHFIVSITYYVLLYNSYKVIKIKVSKNHGYCSTK